MATDFFLPRLLFAGKDIDAYNQKGRPNSFRPISFDPFHAIPFELAHRIA